jgi:alkylhydroperoxidase/carboxymuconolactone decarboxylase family protein YurZ
MDNSGVGSVAGEGMTDPLNMGMWVQSFNPIYSIRIAWEDYLYERNLESKEQHLILQYMMMDLQQQENGEHSPDLHRSIEQTQERLDIIAAKIRKYEER